MNQVKLAVLGHSEPLRWEKIGKVVTRAELVVPGHSEPLQWEKIRKVAIGQNWLFWVILGHFGGKRLEKLQIG